MFLNNNPLKNYFNNLNSLNIDSNFIKLQNNEIDKKLSITKGKLNKEELVRFHEVEKKIKDIFNTKENILTESDLIFLSIPLDIKLKNLKDKIEKCFFMFKEENVFAGVSVFFSLLVIQTYLQIVLSILFGPIVGYNISCILLGPIMEEVFRYIAVKNNVGNEYNSTLNIWELVHYTKNFLNYGIISILFTLILRIIVASELHTKNTERMQEALKKDENTKGLIISIVYHSLWNSIAVLFGTIGISINLLLGKTIFK